MSNTTIYGVFFILYIVMCGFYAFYAVLSTKSNNKFIDYIIVFWLMTFQVYKSRYVWRESPNLGSFRKFDQFLAWSLLFLFVLKIISNEEGFVRKKMLSHEKYIYAFLFLSLFILRIHLFLGNISGSRALAYSRLYISTAIFFYAVSNLVTKELLRAIIKAINFLGVFSALVSVFQFFGDSKFLRLSAFYMAFPGYNRSSGVFSWPYDAGMFQLLSIFTVAYTVRNRRIKTILISLFVFSIALTFTRGVWIASAAVLLLHGYIYYKAFLGKLIIMSSIVVFLTVGLVSAYVFQKEFFKGEAWEGRILVDTVSVRIAFYTFVIQSIPGSWLIGYGDVENNEVYFRGMVNAKQGLAWSLGRRGGIHNVILEEAFLRGIFVPIIFIIYFYKFSKFSIIQTFKKKNYFYCFSNYFSMTFFFYIFSVGQYLVARSGYLTLFFMALATGAYKNNVDVSDLALKLDEGTDPPDFVKKWLESDSIENQDTEINSVQNQLEKSDL